METTNEVEHAKEKLAKKNLDMIVLNNPREKGAGFGHDTNKVTFIYPDNKPVQFELKSKKEVARDIVDAAHKMKHADALK